MLQRVIGTSVAKPKRVIAAWLLVGITLAVLGGLKGYAVTTDDTARFLPKGSDSAKAAAFAREAFGAEEGTANVTVLVQREDGGTLRAGDRAAIDTLAGAMDGWRPDTDRLETEDELDVTTRAGHVRDAAAGQIADDGRLELVTLSWKANATDPIAQQAFRQFRDDFSRRAADRGLQTGYTGGVASLSDQTEADEVRSMVQSLALFGAVIVLSFVFLRGLLASIVPLLTISIVAGTASGLVVLAALLFGFKLDVGTTQLISVVLIGIGVDYFLFLLFRLRERLRAGDDRRTAARHAAERVGPVIASAALVVIAAFGTLALAEFGQFRILGPAIGISVLVMLLAGVTLMPAIAAVTGPKLFWPSTGWRDESAAGPAARLADRIARRPRATALAVTGGLAVLAVLALGTHMSYDLTDSGSDTPAARTAERIATALPKGAVDPQTVYVRADRPLSSAQLRPLVERLRTARGVGAVGEPRLTEDARGASIDLSLTADPASEEAMDAVRGPIRTAARQATPPGSTALVAGTAAVFADVSDSVTRDLRRIFPAAAVLIGLILVVTLRALRTSLLLLAAVALEFAATLGVAVLGIQHLAGQGGVAFTLPLVVFLFVVAVGTDYNLLMSARLREELAAGRTPGDAIRAAVRHVAPAIAAAGLVLASSFATLMLASDAGSREIGFALAVGILIAALLVSSVLVPALAGVSARRTRRAPRDRPRSTPAGRRPPAADRTRTT